MRLLIDVKMTYRVPQDELVHLILEVPQSAAQKVISSQLDVQDATVTSATDDAANCRHTWAKVAGAQLDLRYQADVEVTRATPDLVQLGPTPIDGLPLDALHALQPSRFCQSDLFTHFVTERFGHLSGGAKLASIVDWVANAITYAPGQSDGKTTAMDTFVSRRGVCRDFAHLVCGLARAANIPARYAAVYAPDVSPPDFHAVAEVWIDGAWHLVDATGMAVASEMVVIATGRDASDTAFMETEGWADWLAQSVKVQRA